MYKVCVFIALLLIFPVSNFSIEGSKTKSAKTALSENQKLYKEMGLEKEVSYKAFEQAMLGYKKLKPRNKEVVTLIDFTKPSTKERLYVLDIKDKKLLFKSHVSHGQRSGENYATSFSNKNGSHKSSLGFYTTGQTYKGRNGYSLILNGQERGINDLARKRSIVIHAADYANPSVIESSGRLGRSHGCPALPEYINDTIIDAIKDGSLLYIYADNKLYQNQSRILSRR